MNGASKPTAFGRGAPYCAPPDPEIRKPRFALPHGSCDSHAHVCGPADEFPYWSGRIYTPPDALEKNYATLLAALGVTRAVLVQPSVYGTDNRAMLAALGHLRARGLDCRAVAVVDRDVSDDDLARLDAAGVCGIRFNLVDVADPGSGPSLDVFRGLAHRVAAYDWHTEFLIHVDDYPDFAVDFADWPAPIVIGHMGYCRIGNGPDTPGFQSMLRLAEAGRCWIKLTGPYRVSEGDLPYASAAAYTRTLAEAVPDRLVWGTDWPHVMVTKAMPNDADLVDLLHGWIPDEAIRRAVLVDNPSRLYGFNNAGDKAFD